MAADTARGRKPLMHDVARLAGVSQSTVSVVVDNREAKVGIAGKTTARVLAAIEELGFGPDLAERGVLLHVDRGIDGLLHAAVSREEVHLDSSFGALPTMLVTCWPARARRFPPARRSRR